MREMTGVKTGAREDNLRGGCWWRDDCYPPTRWRYTTRGDGIVPEFGGPGSHAALLAERWGSHRGANSEREGDHCRRRCVDRGRFPRERSSSTDAAARALC